MNKTDDWIEIEKDKPPYGIKVLVSVKEYYPEGEGEEMSVDYDTFTAYLLPEGWVIDSKDDICGDDIEAWTYIPGRRKSKDRYGAALRIVCDRIKPDKLMLTDNLLSKESITIF